MTIVKARLGVLKARTILVNNKATKNNFTFGPISKNPGN